jgi:tape measure domain-containing protein
MARTLADVLVRARVDTSGVGADAGRAGEDAGKALGDGFTRAADGRMRDAKGKFVAAIDGSVGAAAGEGGRRAADTLNKSMSTVSFGNVIRTAASLTAVLGPAGIAGEAVKMGIQTASSLQQAQVGFATLLGSGQKAQDFLKQLSSFAAATPFELHGLIDSSRLLLGVGVNAQQVIPMLTAFGDAAGAVGVGQEQFQRIMLATSQAISAGKFQAQDMNQITENGIPIWKLLAEATGKPVPELRKLSEHGQLLASTVLPLLQKQMEKDYGGAMARQSQTLAGVWSTLQDTISIGLANALQPLVPMLSALIPRAADVAGKAFTVLSTGLSGFFAGLRGQSAGGNASEFAVVMARIGNATRDVGQIITTYVLPALREIGTTLGTAIGWFTSGSTWAGILRAALLAAGGAITAITVGIRIWTAAQAIWNAVMDANPIAIVIIAIAALAAGLIYAYQHSETFRNIVNTALRDVAAVGQWMWNTILKPTFDALVTVWRNVIAPAALWLWHNVLEPAFHGIAAAVQLWWQIASAVFNVAVSVFRNVIAPVVLWIWHNIFETAFQAIWVIVQVWWKLVSAEFSLVMSFIRNVLAPAIGWLWHNIFEPVFHGIGETISFAWNNVIKPVFNALGSFIRDTVAPAFKTGVSAIAAAWDGIKQAASVPVTFVVNHVINPLIHGFNDVAHAFGVKTTVHDIQGFAGGGLIRGPGTGTSDSILAQVAGGPQIAVSNGEFIVPARKVAEVGVDSLNEWIGQPRTRYPGDGSQGLAFASGGLVGFFSDVWSAITNPQKLIAGPVNAAISSIPGGGAVRDMLAGMGHKLVDGLMSYITGGAGGAGGNVGTARSWLLQQVGKPYIWASAGPAGYDCSGIVSAVWNILHGRSPYSHTFSTSNEAPYFPLPGLGGVLSAGWTNPGEPGPGGSSVGHTAGVLAGLPFESTGGVGVRVGPGVTSIGRFAHIGHFARGGLVGIPTISMDTGRGVLQPGANVVLNGTGRQEPVAATGAPSRLDEYTIARLVQALTSRPLVVQIAGPNDLGLSVAGVAP